MKRITAVTVFLVFCGFILPAQEREDGLPEKANKELIVQNLVIGLNSGNLGLRKSCALMLGQIYAERATFPLLTRARGDDDPQVRIAAAWALCRIGTDVGTYIVKQRVTFDDDKNVQAHAAFYYDTYVQKGVFNFVEIKPPAISQMFTPVPVEALSLRTD